MMAVGCRCSCVLVFLYAVFATIRTIPLLNIIYYKYKNSIYIASYTCYIYVAMHNVYTMTFFLFSLARFRSLFRLVFVAHKNPHPTPQATSNKKPSITQPQPAIQRRPTDPQPSTDPQLSQHNRYSSSCFGIWHTTPASGHDTLTSICLQRTAQIKQPFC